MVNGSESGTAPDTGVFVLVTAGTTGTEHPLSEKTVYTTAPVRLLVAFEITVEATVLKPTTNEPGERESAIDGVALVIATTSQALVEPTLLTSPLYTAFMKYVPTTSIVKEADKGATEFTPVMVLICTGVRSAVQVGSE